MTGVPRKRSRRSISHFIDKMMARVAHLFFLSTLLLAMLLPAADAFLLQWLRASQAATTVQDSSDAGTACGPATVGRDAARVACTRMNIACQSPSMQPSKIVENACAQETTRTPMKDDNARRICARAYDEYIVNAEYFLSQYRQNCAGLLVTDCGSALYTNYKKMFCQS